MRSEQLNQDTVIYWGTILLVLGLLILIPQLRILQEVPPVFTEEAYADLVGAENPQTLYQFLLQQLLQSPANDILLTILPLVFALGSLGLFLLHLQFETENTIVTYLAGLLFALSPPFLLYHLSLTKISVLFFFILLASYLYRQQSIFTFVFAAIVFALDPFIGSLLFLLFVWHNYKQGLSLSGFLATLLTLHLVFFFLPFPIPYTSQAFYFEWNQVFSFLGSLSGFTLILLFLGGSGIIREFVQKEQNPFTWTSLLIILSSLVYFPLQIMASLVLSFYAAKSFLSLLKYEFTNKELGVYILLLFVLIFVFSSVTFIKTTIQEAPTREQFQAYSWLEKQPEGKLFIHPYQEHSASFFSKKTAVTLPLDMYSQFVFNRDLESFQKYLESESIRYVVIGAHTFDLLQKDEEGILFLLKNNDAFTQVYAADDLLIFLVE